jgi:Mg-chelatase subunit ChlD
MESIKDTIMQGFNELVQTIKGIENEYPEQEHFISLISFNGLGKKTLHFLDPVSKLEMIDDSRYHPNALTPLYDAMGFSIAKLRHALEKKTDFNVLVTILTDGEENDSKEHDGLSIKKMVDELKQNRWTFTYIGTDHDVEKFALSISITNSMKFQKNEEGIREMFATEKLSRSSYSQKIRNKLNTDDNFYEKDQS